MKVQSKTLTRRRRNAAFTLIEMILVLAIIALLVGAGVMKLTGVMDAGKETAVKTDFAAITSALRLYTMKAGRMPTQEQGLRALVEPPSAGPSPKSWARQMKDLDALMDPWGNMYQYRYPGLKNDEFDVYSLGPDRTDGTEDDIGNW